MNYNVGDKIICRRNSSADGTIYYDGSYKTPNDCPYLRKRKLDKLNDL